MGLAELTLGAQLLGGWLQAGSERRALQKQLAWLREFYAPEMAARKELMGRLGKVSPLLATQHERRERQIRERFAGREAAERAIGRRTGAERLGALGRIEAKREEALSSEALSYGERQQAEIDRVINALLGRGEAGPAIAGVMREMGRVTQGIPEALGTYVAGLETAEAGVGVAGAPTTIPSPPPALAPAPAPTEPLREPRFPAISPSAVATPPSPLEEEDVLGILDASEMPNVRLPLGGRYRRSVRYGRGLRPARV